MKSTYGLGMFTEFFPKEIILVSEKVVVMGVGGGVLGRRSSMLEYFDVRSIEHLRNLKRARVAEIC